MCIASDGGRQQKGRKSDEGCKQAEIGKVVKYIYMNLSQGMYYCENTQKCIYLSASESEHMGERQKTAAGSEDRETESV